MECLEEILLEEETIIVEVLVHVRVLALVAEELVVQRRISMEQI